MTRFQSRVITDPAVLSVLDQMHDQEEALEERWRREEDRGDEGQSLDPFAWADTGFSISAGGGDLLYLLARNGRPQVVVEFATSLGFSTIYLACALRDNGAGTVHGVELVPEKAAAARANLERAGLSAVAEIAVGDARKELLAVPGPIDLLLVDGWPTDGPEESLSLQVLRLLESRLRPGALVLNDNHEEDYLAHVRDPDNGYVSTLLPIAAGRKHGFEVSLRR